MYKILFVIAGLLLSGAAICQQLNIIPQPVQAKRLTGDFKLSKNTVIAVRYEEDKKTALYLNGYLQQVYGFSLDIDKQESKNYIRLSTKNGSKGLHKDAYTLEVDKDGVTIEGDTYAGTFYGVQTLIQLFEPYDFSSIISKKNGISVSSLLVPSVSIADYPRFAYRGMHLDVGRHLFPVSFIKKYIDYIALHKMNFFHWHLTEDQGWRIQINKYPKLTEVGAFRNGTIVGPFPGNGNDNQRYGGFYTQDEVKEIVAYATSRHITVVPEIEMPGHASAAIASYPFLSCFPDRKTVIPKNSSKLSDQQQANGRVKLVQETWGVFDDVFCAGNDSVFTFLEGVIDEVLTLFSSKYIHIGGDESPKTHWKECPKCQARMKSEGLKDEHELQSWFVQKMEKYLNSKGRTLIGWDEILEGGLAPNAVVMSWRGEEGGIAAANQQHPVIMTPQSPIYFDHSQTKNEDSVTIGGYNPIEKVYAYEPIPKELPPQNAQYILGAQANVWTEYMEYPSKVEYMIFPRMSALSEVLWSPKETKNWPNFERRLQVQKKRYGLWGANYSKPSITTAIVPTKAADGVQWQLQNNAKRGAIIFTSPQGKIIVFNGDSASVTINSPGTYTAWIADGDQNLTPGNAGTYTKLSTPVEQTFSFNKATGKSIRLTAQPDDKYAGQIGAFSLVNGVLSSKGLSNGDWLGWTGDDMVAFIDLGKPETFSKVSVHTLEQKNSWIYAPQWVEVWISKDGKNYLPAGKNSDFVSDTLSMGYITVAFPKQALRYVKVIAKNEGVIPDKQPGAGNKAWLFADEIKVE